MDLFSFIKQTEGLENSLNFAIEHGVLPSKNPGNCIKCGRIDGYRWTKNSRVVNLPYMFVCAQRECRSTIGLGRNTIFDHIPFPLSKALRMIYFWLLKISVKETANQLELLESTINEFFQYFREVCAFIIINYTKAIGGPGQVVEISEYKLESNDESQSLWLFTGVDRSSGQNFAIHVDDLECETLLPVMKNYILPGTQVVTQRFREFTKKEKSQSLKFVNPNKKPRTEDDYHLDELYNAMKRYLENEMPPDGTQYTELFAYQFLYFSRDECCNKPASELITSFLSDVKLAYPGFAKERIVEYNTDKN